jgi:anaerobic selenocysteine-containing dehydrogenase
MTSERRNRPFTVGRWRSRVRELPEVMGELPVVAMAEEMDTPGEGQIKALVVIAGNPVLTNPGADRLDQALAGLELMVSVDPYINVTSRHAHYVLPPPSPLERAHYDLAFTQLSVRNYADFSPPVFETDAMTEFDILVKLTAIAAGMGPEAEPAFLAEATLAQMIQSGVDDPGSPIHGRDPSEISAALGDRPAVERILDLMIRTGSRGDGFGSDPGGLNLGVIEANPHGLDLGALEPRIPAVLATASGMVELAPEAVISDLPRLETAMGSAANGLRLVGRRQLRTVNSWLNNVETSIRGKETCVLEIHPKDAERLEVADGAEVEVASDSGSLRVPARVTEDISEGVVSLPYGWGHDYPGVRLGVATTRPGVNMNKLTPRAEFDPLSGNAVLNGVPVTVTPA